MKKWHPTIVFMAVACVVCAVPAAASTGWAVQPTPNPSTSGNTLVSVSCLAGNCTAVGHSHKKTTQYGQVPVPLAERWNGTRWSIQPGPQPGAQGSSLTGVSCPSASSCTAVGYYTAKSGRTRTLAERWNGTSWATQATPNPALDVTAVFNGVSCRSASACTAVGWYINNTSGGNATLVERWNGTRWSIQPTPNPAGAVQSVLQGVSCPSASSCTAAGSYFTSGSPSVTLAEHWDGTHWAIQPTPNPPGANGSVLNGVSCSAASCTAAGWWYSPSASAELTLAERWDGTSWAIQATPNPAGAADTILESVSCPSATACTAVGITTSPTSNPAAVAEAWNGVTWAVQPTSSPAKAQATELSGVSCVTAATCTAVGHWNYNALNSVGQTLAEHK
jgi:hypothetical protein